MFSLAKFREAFEKQCEEEVALFFRTVPHAEHLTDPSTDLDETYYIRHRVETIKRIQMTARTDALALVALIREHYDLARKWAKYTLQEMNHDLMFLRDLKEHGYSQEQVVAIAPFEATKHLGIYLENSINTYGPIAAVAYSLFVEWNSDRYSKKTVEKAMKKYSSKHTAGAKAHVHFDEDQDHYQLIVEIAYRLIENDGHARQLFQITKDISALFRAYFTELYHHTIAQQSL